MTKENKKEYLGDSVYAEFDGQMIRLTTENGGMIPSNEIFLEAEVYHALTKFVESFCQPPKEAA